MVGAHGYLPSYLSSCYLESSYSREDKFQAKVDCGSRSRRPDGDCLRVDPNLDVEPLEVAGRLLRCATYLGRAIDEALRPLESVCWRRPSRHLPGPAEWHVCHETIYQAIYHGGRGGLSRKLTKRLRAGRPLRKRRRRPEQRQVRFVAPGLLIKQRPAEVDDRVRVGDWERDLIVGRNNHSAIATLVDRTSRYLRLVHLPIGRAAEVVRDALQAMLMQLPAAVRLTLTWDQGTELAYHDQLAPLLRDGVFFAHPGSPWQRGTTENTNGLLRQYLPKRTDLSVHTAADLRAIEQRLNNRPRKVLDWRTPANSSMPLWHHKHRQRCDDRWNPP